MDISKQLGVSPLITIYLLVLATVVTPSITFLRLLLDEFKFIFR